MPRLGNPPINYPTRFADLAHEQLGGIATVLAGGSVTEQLADLLSTIRAQVAMPPDLLADLANVAGVGKTMADITASLEWAKFGLVAMPQEA